MLLLLIIKKESLHLYIQTLKKHKMTKEINAYKESLVSPIENEEQAKQYIKVLYNANLYYHFDDDVTDIIWSDYSPSKNEMKLMNKRCNEMRSLKNFDVYELPNNLKNE